MAWKGLRSRDPFGSPVSGGAVRAASKTCPPMKRTSSATAPPLPDAGGHQTLSDYIQARFDEFSRSQKDVAQYIVDHLDEVAFQTAEELARRANTSSSTVVRFSQALGFEGFPELQGSAREEYRRRVAQGPGAKQAQHGRLGHAALLARPERRARPRSPPTTSTSRTRRAGCQRSDVDAAIDADRRRRPRADRGHRPDGVLRQLPAPPADAARPAGRGRGQPVAGGAEQARAHRRAATSSSGCRPGGRIRWSCAP